MSFDSEKLYFNPKKEDIGFHEVTLRVFKKEIPLYFSELSFKLEVLEAGNENNQELISITDQVSSFFTSAEEMSEL